MHRARGILHAYTQRVECGQWWCSAMVVGSNICHFMGQWWCSVWRMGALPKIHEEIVSELQIVFEFFCLCGYGSC
jgi:hypothetical protein